MKLNRIAAMVAIATCLLPSARGQGLLGPWEAANVFYVSDDNTIASDSNPGTLPIIPFRTVTFALQQAAAATSQNRLPSTINVLSGTYSTETFPLQIPAFGVSIEAYGPTRPVFDTLQTPSNGAPVVLEVANLIDPVVNNPPAPLPAPNPVIQPTDLPPSNINGLEILHGRRGVRVAVTQTGTTPATVRMEIRDCDIYENAVGIEVEVSLHRNELVIEHNYIHENLDVKANTGTGLLIRNQGVSSSLVRANRIYTNEVNLQIVNSTGNAEDCRERVFSNFIDDAEWNVEMRDCAPRLTNNTIAFARPFPNGGQPKGIQYRCFNAINGRLTLLNNIIWNPGPWNPPAGTEDILRLGNFVSEIFNNDIEDPSDPAVGTNANFSLTPPFDLALGIPERLHLLPVATTPAIWGGANPLFLRAAGTPQPFVAFNPAMILVVGGQPVRIDVPVDVDMDSRFLQIPQEPAFTADIGADEISVCAVVPGAGIDPFGTITTNTGTTPWTGLLRLTGPPNAGVFPMMCLNNPGQPTDENTLMVPLGNIRIDTFTSGSLPFVQIGAAGFVDIPINFGNFNAAYWEGDAYVQALVTDATGSWVTNRVRLEADF